MRTLALDVGDRRIGVAVSDALNITAQGLETYWRTESTKKDVAYILELLQKYAPCRLLMGMPMNMNGTVGEQGEKVKRFAEAIQKEWDGEIVFFDERLTTMTARRVLLDADISRGKQKKVIDKLAAVIILQGYMDSHPNL
ncbi:MAG: Holliday junction resolvase RuvX [Clostridia bacterium]|nr:Holliday junction resolvase RuvX [Clostridia bacterium]MBR3271767.1 Holliday junction resolvase RuvX [Clostridia bacterium]